MYLRDTRLVGNTTSQLEISIQEAYLTHKYLHIPRERKDLFPTTLTDVQLEAEFENGRKETVQARFSPSGPSVTRGGIRKWFDAHPELHVGGRLRLTVRDKTTYRLEIL